MFETLTGPRFMTGAALGCVLAVFVWLLTSYIRIAFGGSWHSKARYSLSQKLHVLNCRVLSAGEEEFRQAQKTAVLEIG